MTDVFTHVASTRTVANAVSGTVPGAVADAVSGTVGNTAAGVHG